MEEFKLYVVGASENPDDWSDFHGHKLVMARSCEEAASMDEFSTTAHEVKCTRPMVLADYNPCDAT